MRPVSPHFLPLSIDDHHEIGVEQAEQERVKQERVKQERAERERLERERVEQERAEKERVEEERVELRRLRPVETSYQCPPDVNAHTRSTQLGIIVGTFGA